MAPRVNVPALLRSVFSTRHQRYPIGLLDLLSVKAFLLAVEITGLLAVQAAKKSNIIVPCSELEALPTFSCLK